MRCGWASRVRWGLLAVLVGVLLCLGMGAVKEPDLEPPGIRLLREAPPEAQAAVWRTLNIDYQMVDLSLEVREQADFLLTPALLVQEAVSDGVVLTYPEE